MQFNAGDTCQWKEGTLYHSLFGRSQIIKIGTVTKYPDGHIEYNIRLFSGYQLLGEAVVSEEDAQKNFQKIT